MVADVLGTFWEKRCRMDADKLLEKEIRIFEECRGDLVGRYSGKYVLIHEGAKPEVFDTKGDAIRHGYERFGNVPFLVRKIDAIERALDLVSNLVGV